MEHNFKVKTVVNMLRNHSRIREVNSRPIVLQWIEAEKSNEDSVLSDDSDDSDAIAKKSVDKRTGQIGKPKTEIASDTSDTSDRNVNKIQLVESITYRCPDCNCTSICRQKI